MSHARSLLGALLLTALLGVAGCGSNDDTGLLPQESEVTTETVTGGGSVDEAPRPKTCADLRVEWAVYDELYRELRCVRQRRALCRGLTRESIRYDDYRCARLQTVKGKKRKDAAKRKAIAASRAERKKAAAKEKATAKRVERNGFGGGSVSRGSGGSSRSSGSSSTSSGGGSSSSSSASGGSSSSSSSSGGGRRR